MALTNFVVHDNVGLKLLQGPNNFCPNENFENLEGKVKCFCSSSNGKRIAWVINGEVQVVEAPNWKRIGTLTHARAQEICFSPLGNYLAIWDIYSKVNDSTPTPNLSVYDVSGRKLLKAFFQKSQSAWQPQWTKDESIMARMVTSEIHFYKADDLQTIEHKKVLPKVRSFSMSPSINHHHCTFFIPGVKDAPAIVQLYKYPNFSSTAIANKSFFKVDTIEAFWNTQCTAVLLLTTSEVEKGSSYYGQQMLFYLGTRGQSNRVSFSKDGNIRSVAWTKSGKEFFCVYGAAPARATLYNNKCDIVIEFGEGARNIVMPNPAGNIVLLGGLGNIASRFEMWDISTRKLLNQQECSDITHMEWSPCGQYLLTSTCFPRLRVNNGYKVWHYTGVLLHENIVTEGELYKASWLPDANLGEDFVISNKKVNGIDSQEKTASKERYMPPSQRLAAAAGGAVDTSKKFLSQRDDPFKTITNGEAKIKKKKKRDEKKEGEKKKKEEEKKKKEDEKGINKDWRTERPPKEEKPKVENASFTKDNRIKNIKKKLHHIKQLKTSEESGKTLTDAFKAKIGDEEKLKTELEQLSL